MKTTQRIVSAAALAALLLSTTAPAQAPDFSKVEVKATPLAEGLHVLEGAGGAITVLHGPDGVLLVDSQYAALTDKLVAAVRRLSDRPLRFLVNTHHHPDHVGGNENFARQGMVVLAHAPLRARVAAPGAQPVVTYESPVTLHLNGEAVRLVPIRAAHTDGDTLVHFPKADVIAVGDYLRSLGYPRVDLGGGGSLDGLLAAFAQTVALAGPKTRIVPGHGALMDREAVVAQHRLVLAVRDAIAPLVARGATVDEVLAAKPTAPWDAQVPQGRETAEQFVRWLYAELARGR